MKIIHEISTPLYHGFSCFKKIGILDDGRVFYIYDFGNTNSIINQYNIMSETVGRGSIFSNKLIDNLEKLKPLKHIMSSPKVRIGLSKSVPDDLKYFTGGHSQRWNWFKEG